MVMESKEEINSSVCGASTFLFQKSGTADLCTHTELYVNSDMILLSLSTFLINLKDVMTWNSVFQ